MKPEKVLSDHNLKKTGCREGILDVIISSPVALSEHEIKQQLNGNYDRTTFYRSFRTLEDKKILHKVVIDDHTVKYAFGEKMEPGHTHAHFYCNQCNLVKCMETIPAVRHDIPEAFMIQSTEMIVKGICIKCKDIKS